MSTDTDSDLVLQRTRTARIACDNWNPIPYWIATGTVMAYACSALMAIGGLNIHDLNVIYITSVFIPSNILLHTLMLFLWHRPQARHRFAPLTRTLMSCATVNLWAGGCVGAFYTVDTAMWIAGWWFVGIPGALLIGNRALVDGMEWWLRRQTRRRERVFGR